MEAILGAASGSQEGEGTIQVSFKTLFLGNTSELLSPMKKSFPDLDLEAKDCHEMSWIQSVLYYANLYVEPEHVLLNRIPRYKMEDAFPRGGRDNDLKSIWWKDEYDFREKFLSHIERGTCIKFSTWSAGMKREIKCQSST